MADKMTDEEYTIVGALTDLITKLRTSAKRYQVAEWRYEVMCNHSEIQNYECMVQVPFGKRFCCDMCLEEELFDLWGKGVHTVGSCCGHGKMQAYIQVDGVDAVVKMNEMGYELLPEESSGCGKNCYKPKTYLPIVERVAGGIQTMEEEG